MLVAKTLAVSVVDFYVMNLTDLMLVEFYLTECDVYQRTQYP